MSHIERRHNRSANTTRALCLQLDACIRTGKFEGMVLADDDGVCLAAAGDDYACNEIAAHLPLMGRKVPSFEGVLFGPEDRYNIEMRRFEVEGAHLYVCAIGDSAGRSQEIDRSIGGVERILYPQAA